MKDMSLNSPDRIQFELGSIFEAAASDPVKDIKNFSIKSKKGGYSINIETRADDHFQPIVETPQV